MRRVISATVMAALLVWPTHSLAQESSERVILDIEMPVQPPGDDGICLYLGEGTLTVNAAVTRAPMVPTGISFKLRGLMETRQGLVIDRELGAEWPVSVAVNGGRYCWSLETRTSAGVNNLPMADRGAYAADMALKMTLSSKQ